MRKAWGLAFGTLQSVWFSSTAPSNSPAATPSPRPTLETSTSSPITLQFKTSNFSTPQRCPRRAHRSTLNRPHPRPASAHRSVCRQDIRHRPCRKRSLEPMVLPARTFHAPSANIRPRIPRCALGLGIFFQHLCIWIQHWLPFHRVGRWCLQRQLSRHR